METKKCEYSDLHVIPGHLEFSAKDGTKYVCANQSLSIKKVTGGGTLSPTWSLQIEGANASWLDAKPMSGRDRTKVIVRVDPRGLIVGTYEAQIAITSSAEAVTITPPVIPVTLVVKGKKEPPEEPEQPEEPEEPKEPEQPEKPEQPEEPEEPKPPEKPEPPKEPDEPPKLPDWVSTIIELIKKLLEFFKKR